EPPDRPLRTRARAVALRGDRRERRLRAHRRTDEGGRDRGARHRRGRPDGARGGRRAPRRLARDTARARRRPDCRLMLLHLHEWGGPSAPPLVCLHGVTGHGRRFRRLAEERLAERFRVLAPDLRGHGRSAWEPPWTLRANLADVLETVAAAGVDRAVWLGHSYGGRLILELAALEPDRIERAVL